jgi:hypothetical protein
LLEGEEGSLETCMKRERGEGEGEREREVGRRETERAHEQREKIIYG